MAYGITTENKATTGGGQYMEAGIHNNVELSGIAKGDFNGDTVLDFEFVDEGGAQFRHRVFQLDEARAIQYAKENLQNMKPYQNESTAKFNERKSKAKADLPNAVNAAYKKDGDHMLHILSTFVPQEELVVKIGTATSFDDYCDKIIAAMGDSFVGVKVRIKITLNKKERTQFPKSIVGGFIQLMSKPNTLQITKYDVMEKSAPTSESSYDDYDAGTVPAGELDDVFKEEPATADVDAGW